MNKLIPMEFEGQRIMTTKVLAEQYGATEKMISNNFLRNKDRFVEGKHYFELRGEELKSFKEGLPLLEDNLKYAPVLYLWTEKGALRHAKILDTDKAWEVYEVLEDTYFRAKEQIPQLSKELQAIFALDQRTVEMDSRIKKLENNMTIDYAQQNNIREKANAKIVSVLGGKDAPAYQKLNKKAFSQFWKDYRRYMQVASYKDTPVAELEKAKDFIKRWTPNEDLRFMILGANSQMRIES